MADVPRSGRVRRQKGRNEIALDQDLVQHKELARSVRAMLRAMAALLDRAEATGDIEAGARLAHEFHDQLAAAGIAVPAVKTADAWDVLLAELARPGTGSSNRPD